MTALSIINDEIMKSIYFYYLLYATIICETFNLKLVPGHVRMSWGLNG